MIHPIPDPSHYDEASAHAVDTSMACSLASSLRSPHVDSPNAPSLLLSSGMHRSLWTMIIPPLGPLTQRCFERTCCRHIHGVRARSITALFSCPDVHSPPANGSNPHRSPANPRRLHRLCLAPHSPRPVRHLLRSLPPLASNGSIPCYPRLLGSSSLYLSSSGHRLFISAFMIPSKVLRDDANSNKSWWVVGLGMFSLREIDHTEGKACSEVALSVKI